jgi:hypothetical protein
MKTTKTKTVNPKPTTKDLNRKNLRTMVEVGTAYAACFLGAFVAVKEFNKFMSSPLEEQLDDISKGLDMVKNSIK